MYFAQTLNTLAAQNYTQFANEQYFDSAGLFITLILLLPCAFNCIFFIVSKFILNTIYMVYMCVMCCVFGILFYDAYQPIYKNRQLLFIND